MKTWSYTPRHQLFFHSYLLNMKGWVGTEPSDVFHKLPVICLAATYLPMENSKWANYYHFEPNVVLLLVFKERKKSQVWRFSPVIPAFWRQRQENHEFVASLGYRVKCCLKKKKKKKRGRKKEKRAQPSLASAKVHNQGNIHTCSLLWKSNC
jgi:hypothetical protein